MPTGMRIVVLRETGWAGVVNEKSLEAELVRLSGHGDGLFWLGERKDSRRVWRIFVFCDEFYDAFS